MDNKILNSIAIQILLTENPSINLSAKSIINALITNKNNPRVNTVIGKVRITKIGLTIRLSKDNTIATIIAVV